MTTESFIPRNGDPLLTSEGRRGHVIYTLRETETQEAEVQVFFDDHEPPYTISLNEAYTLIERAQTYDELRQSLFTGVCEPILKKFWDRLDTDYPRSNKTFREVLNLEHLQFTLEENTGLPVFRCELQDWFNPLEPNRSATFLYTAETEFDELGWFFLDGVDLK